MVWCFQSYTALRASSQPRPPLVRSREEGVRAGESDFAKCCCLGLMFKKKKKKEDHRVFADSEESVFHCLFGLSALWFFSLFCRYQQNYHLPKYSTPVSLLKFMSSLVAPVAGSSTHLGIAHGVGELLRHPLLSYLWFSAKCEHIWRTEMEASEHSVWYGDAVGQEL